MINLTRINREEIILNSDLIESISRSPDTIILLTTGKTLMVLESPEEIKKKVIEFRRLILQGPAIR